ncbi:hypothetical protein ACJX0J_031978, partial [Zea mays]
SVYTIYAVLHIKHRMLMVLSLCSVIKGRLKEQINKPWKQIWKLYIKALILSMEAGKTASGQMKLCYMDPYLAKIRREAGL